MDGVRRVAANVLLAVAFAAVLLLVTGLLYAADPDGGDFTEWTLKGGFHGGYAALFYSPLLLLLLVGVELAGRWAPDSVLRPSLVVAGVVFGAGAGLLLADIGELQPVITTAICLAAGGGYGLLLRLPPNAQPGRGSSASVQVS